VIWVDLGGPKRYIGPHEGAYEFALPSLLLSLLSTPVLWRREGHGLASETYKVLTNPPPEANWQVGFVFLEDFRRSVKRPR
jgi:hypothetical protein